jgi:alpha-galactosidase/6-phospho-beta-glucosidase family protein
MEVLPPSETIEEHIPFIDSIANGIERKLMLNVPNEGAIPGIPDDILVEIPVICNAAGINNVQMGSLPPRLMNNVIIPRLGTALNILNAYENHDREELVLWLCKDPRTRSYEQAKNLIDKLLAQPWNKAAQEHYC